jgi:hypothetical protein
MNVPRGTSRDVRMEFISYWLEWDLVILGYSWLF